MAGAGFGQWLGKAFNWLKSNKILSTIGKAVSPIFPAAAPITSALGAVGLGRRRRRVGTGLNLAGARARYGMGLGLAGGRRGMRRLLM